MIIGKGDEGGCVIDVYRVLQAFDVTNPQLQHLIKKALACGLRGHKDRHQDLIDIRDSAQSALDMYEDVYNFNKEGKVKTKRTGNDGLEPWRI